MSLEMAPQDGPAGWDSPVGPRSHSGASQDQYGVSVQVRYGTVVRHGRISRIRRTLTCLNILDKMMCEL